MSTASLLSGGGYDKHKQNSMQSNRSNYGSQKKLNFKVSVKTPSNYFGDRGSSTKFSDDGNYTDEDKLRMFHARLEEYKFYLVQKHLKSVEVLPFNNKS